AGPADRLGVEPDPLSPAVAGIPRRFGQCPPVRLTRLAVAAAGAPHRVPLGRGGGLRRRTLRLHRAAAGHSGVVVVVPARTRGAGVAGDRATGLAGRSDPGGGRCGNRPLVLLPRTGDVLLLRPPVRTIPGAGGGVRPGGADHPWSVRSYHRVRIRPAVLGHADRRWICAARGGLLRLLLSDLHRRGNPLSRLAGSDVGEQLDLTISDPEDLDLSASHG